MSAAESAQAPRVEIAVAVVEDNGRFLIGIRGRDVPLGGLWEFPGGKILPGESPAEAAARECLEETGLPVRVTGVYPTVDYDYEHARVRLHFLACDCPQRRAALPGRFRWVAARELHRFAFPPANAGLLALLTAGTTA